MVLTRLKRLFYNDESVNFLIMEETKIPSLNSQLLALQAEHRMLDLEINRLQEFAYIDQLALQRQKRKKLRLKQNIERIRNLLIPDWDA